MQVPPSGMPLGYQQPQFLKITLCGSLRFEKTWKEWNERLTLEGHTVYTVTVYPSDKEGNKDWYDTETKNRLDVAHLMKIMNSDAIFVIDVEKPGDEPYIGESTFREILFAQLLSKRVMPLSNYFKNIQKMEEYAEMAKAAEKEQAANASASETESALDPSKLN